MKLLAAISLLIFALTSPVHGWGGIGHRTVGYLAQKHFNSQGTALFNELIYPDAKFDVSDAAVWADFQTWRWPYTKPWHYIDAKDDPPRSCKVNYSADCPKDQGCIVSAIINMTARVNSDSLSRYEQNNALKFLLHFIGDIHQPLHTEDTCRGGNDIMVGWGRRTVKLHAVWDTEIIHKLLGYKKPPHADPGHVYEKFLAKGWAEALASNEEHAEDIAAECTDVTKPEKCALEWATEANRYICSFVLKAGEKTDRPMAEDDCKWEWKGPNDLSKEYYEDAVPVVEEMVKKAGIRLGAWVNGLAAERAAMMSLSGDGSEGHLLVQGNEREL